MRTLSALSLWPGTAAISLLIGSPQPQSAPGAGLSSTSTSLLRLVPLSLIGHRRGECAGALGSRFDPLWRLLADSSAASPQNPGLDVGHCRYRRGDSCVLPGPRGHETRYRFALAECFLLAAPGLGRRAASNSSAGRVLMTFFFSSQPRRAIVTP